MKRLLLALMLAACDDPMAPPPPPVEPMHTLPVLEPSTGEPEPCPWSGACADLEPIDECGGWAVACGDGWRCIDTEAEAGIVCEGSSSSGDETT